MAVREQHFKRRLAYSTISNLSYMLMGAALMTPDGMVGSLSHLVIHGVIKITLFYCAGAILIKTGKEYAGSARIQQDYARNVRHLPCWAASRWSARRRWQASSASGIC